MIEAWGPRVLGTPHRYAKGRREVDRKKKEKKEKKEEKEKEVDNECKNIFVSNKNQNEEIVSKTRIFKNQKL